MSCVNESLKAPIFKLSMCDCPGEYASGHVPSAINVTLAHLEQEVSNLNPNRATAVICASGYRSSAATSILERHRFTEIYNVVGGTNGR